MLGYGLPVAELKVAVQKTKRGARGLINGDNLKTDYRKVVGIILTILPILNMVIIM
jgi:hypothetical protein